MNNREVAKLCYFSTILVIVGLVKCSYGESMLCNKQTNTVNCVKVKGDFLQDIQSKNIKAINFENSSLTHLCEQGFTKFTDVSVIIIDECNDTSNALTCILSLPQLTALTIINSNIGENFFTALQTKSFLGKLSLKGNKMQYIDKSYFKHLLRLEEIDLSHNNIYIIKPYAFKGLSALRKLDISYNRLKGAFKNIFGMGVFDNLSRLEEIDLSHNKISTIEPDAFKGLSALRKLDISYNRLKDAFNNILGMGVFDTLSRLEEIDLSHNNISTIEPDAFKGLSALKKLDLSGNRLSGDFNSSALGLSVDCVFQSLVVIWPGAGKICYPSERYLYSAPQATTVDPQQGQGRAVEGEVDREGTAVDDTNDSVKGDSGGGLSGGMVVLIVIGPPVIIALLVGLPLLKFF